MDFPKRIEAILLALNMNQTALAKALGVSRGIVSEFSSGARDPSKDFMFGISKLGISLDWFLTGDGPMFLDEKQNSLVFDLEGQIQHSVEFQRSSRGEESIPAKLSDRGPPGFPFGPPEESKPGDLVGARMEGARSIDLSVPQSEEKVVIELFSGVTAGAGPGREVEEYQPTTPQEIMRRFIQPWRPDQVRALEVRGDSMTKIGVFDRDIILFVPSERDGDGIFVISIEGKLQVKRLEFDLLGKSLRIISENDRYQPRTLTDPDEIQRVRIVGKVVGWLHRHPY